MNEPTYTLEQLNFNGPRDLLLQLLEKNRVDIYDIPIAEITAQYFAYVQQMEETDLDVVSGFLVMAATLLDIKARMLLPGGEEEEEEEGDPREELVRRLLEYKRYKYIAHELDFYEDYAARFMYRDGPLPEDLPVLDHFLLLFSRWPRAPFAPIEILLEKEITILVNLNSGEAQATAWGCDLTYDYVKINGDYRS